LLVSRSERQCIKPLGDKDFCQSTANDRGLQCWIPAPEPKLKNLIFSIA